MRSPLSDFSSSDAPRQGIGSFLRNVIDFIGERGFAAAVLAKVSPGTRAVWESPPRAFSWVPSRHIDELETAFLQVAGEQQTVEMGRVASKNLGTTIVKPVLRMAFTLLGQSPATIFANLDRFFSLVTKGIHFEWTEPRAKGGVLVASFDGPATPRAALLVLQGSLQFVFELCGGSGEVTAPEVLADGPEGTRVRYAVSWR